MKRYKFDDDEVMSVRGGMGDILPAAGAVCWGEDLIAGRGDMLGLEASASLAAGRVTAGSTEPATQLLDLERHPCVLFLPAAVFATVYQTEARSVLVAHTHSLTTRLLILSGFPLAMKLCNATEFDTACTSSHLPCTTAISERGSSRGQHISR